MLVRGLCFGVVGEWVGDVLWVGSVGYVSCLACCANVEYGFIAYDC